MKIFNSIGSKERLFEMMNRVNKIKINEAQVFDTSGVFNNTFEALKNKQLSIQKTNVESEDNISYVELVCVDRSGNRIIFRFEASASGGEQDGVYKIDSVILKEFSFVSKDGENEIDLDEYGLKKFNEIHSDELMEIVSEYLNFNEDIPEIEEGYLDAIKKIDSYPFGGTPRTMKSSSAYGDEQPTNPKLRVKSPQLDKFVDENFEDEVKNPVVNETAKYPQGIGQKFKTKKQYTGEKKKRKKNNVTTINEEEFGDDKQMADTLLGYKPKNVGEEIE